MNNSALPNGVGAYDPEGRAVSPKQLPLERHVWHSQFALHPTSGQDSLAHAIIACMLQRYQPRSQAISPQDMLSPSVTAFDANGSSPLVSEIVAMHGQSPSDLSSTRCKALFSVADYVLNKLPRLLAAKW
eukprot:scaffold264158_cov33-Prasinocladus_malaysianus.AAC.5